jgi:hypothetical protein
MVYLLKKVGLKRSLISIQLFLLLCAWGISPSHSQIISTGQSAHEKIDASVVLCAIEYRLKNSANGLRGAVTCGPRGSGVDFFFIAGNWYDNFSSSPICDCDEDFDGITACEELLLCFNPGSNDTDGDCLGDGLEVLLGLDPLSPDSDGDQTADSDEDLDDDGIPEVDEDYDQDGLTNCQEISLGTNPGTPDTDGDGWNDETEATVGSDPLDPLSKPAPQIVALSTVNLSQPDQGLDFLAVNRVGVHLTVPGSHGELPMGTVIAYPPVYLEPGEQP